MYHHARLRVRHALLFTARTCPRPVCLVLAVLVLLMFLAFVPASRVGAQGGELRNDPKRGLIYDGLKRSQRNNCRNGFTFRTVHSKRPFCTHGPDPSPLGTTVKESVRPLAESNAAALVTCETDGQSGNRFQVLYARAADKPDRYSAYVSSIQQWAAEIDTAVSNSAHQTGGERHVRYVHDVACRPIVENVVLPVDGDDTITNMIFALQTMGYTRPDRNYLVFMDATIYCGIATIAGDDSPLAENKNNIGSFYARVDSGCWNGPTAAHELMHNLGGVQLTAPHATLGWHCVDEYDRMCYPDSSSVVMQYLCESSNDLLFDCNHDDYFNTNPPPNSYLATHWNTANNSFLIGAPVLQILSADSLQTGALTKKGVLNLTDSFKRGATATIRAHVLDQNNTALAGVQATVQVESPDGSVLCPLSLNTDASGVLQGDCDIPRKAPAGTWYVRVTKLAKPNYMLAPNSINEHSFTVTAK